MRRVIESISYVHDEHGPGITVEATLQGVTETRVVAEWRSVAGTEEVHVTDVDGHPLEGVLAEREGMSEVEVYAQMAAILSDIEKAEQLNRKARRGLSTYVLDRVKGGA